MPGSQRGTLPPGTPLSGGFRWLWNRFEIEAFCKSSASPLYSGGPDGRASLDRWRARIH